MRVSIVVEADYNDIHDQVNLKFETLQSHFRLLAQRVETDYRNRNGEQNKYGVFYQIYKLDAGGLPKRQRQDNAANAALNQLQLIETDPKIKPEPKADK